MTDNDESHSSTKRVTFKLHHNLLNHLVDRQAATPEKAMLELVMNAADAGATRADIVLTDEGFEITDNGGGFASETDIEHFFATFGTPQEADKTYGRYRVGRAQIFGWASTIWESNRFRMEVDLASDQEGFRVSDLSPPLSGCRIRGTWTARSEALGGIHADTLRRSLAQALMFPPLEVWINGERIAMPTAAQEWTSQTPQAYFRLETFGPLRIYNQGVFVCQIPHATYHVGGLVVTKEAIELTMARNEPLPYAPGWMLIDRHLREQATVLHQSGTSVGTDEFRAYALRQGLLGKGDLQAESVTTIPKRHISLEDFSRDLCKTRTLIYASRGNLAAVEAAIDEHFIQGACLHFDTIERLRIVLGLTHEEDEEVIEHFLYALDELLRKQGGQLPVIRIYSESSLPEPKGGGVVLEWEDLTLDEQWFLNESLPIWESLARQLGEDPRDTHLAATEGKTKAFTDGYTFVALSRDLVEAVLSQKQGTITAVVLAYVHELCHVGDSRNAGHDDVFYTRFHEKTVAQARHIERAVTALARVVRRARPNAPFRVGLVDEIDAAWWSPDVELRSDWYRSQHMARAARAALADLDAGKITPTQHQQRIQQAFDKFSDSDNRSFYESVEGRSARPLQLCGPVGLLMRRGAFDRHPTPEMLTRFGETDWAELSFRTEYLSNSTASANIYWGRHRMGSLEIQAKQVKWKPNQRGPDRFEEFFTLLAAGSTEAFPRTTREFLPDLAWVMVAKLTLEVWRDGDFRVQGRVGNAIRVRRASDRPASSITVAPSQWQFGKQRREVTTEWREALFAAHPDLVELDGVQLLHEGLAAFATDAAAVESTLDATRFWLRWMEPR